MTTNDGSLRYEKFEMKHTTPRPVRSAICRSESRKKTNVKFVKVVLLDLPILSKTVLVGLNEIAFFSVRDSCEGVVGRIAEDDENRFVAFDVLRGIALFLQLGERKLRLYALRRLPAGRALVR